MAVLQGEVEFRSKLYVPPIAHVRKNDIIDSLNKKVSLYAKWMFVSDDFHGELVKIMAKVLIRDECHFFFSNF